jgi:hypothetical protein
VQSWVFKPSIAGCGRFFLFLLEPVTSLGRELWLTIFERLQWVPSSGARFFIYVGFSFYFWAPLCPVCLLCGILAVAGFNL